MRRSDGPYGAGELILATHLTDTLSAPEVVIPPTEQRREECVDLMDRAGEQTKGFDTGADPQWSNWTAITAIASSMGRCR